MIKTWIRKKILRYCIKHIKYSTQSFDNYLFWRFLVEYTQDPDEIKKIIKAVADSSKDIYSVKGLYFLFDDMVYINNTIIILTARPGFWIGKHGNNLQEMTANVRRLLNNDRIEIRFIENQSLNNKRFYRYLSENN